GQNLKQVFDFATDLSPPRPNGNVFLDISYDGSKLLWTDSGDTQLAFFVSDTNGNNITQLAKQLPGPNGSTTSPALPFGIGPRISADGSHVYFLHVLGGAAFAGGYVVDSGGGSAPTQLFSYQDIANVLTGGTITNQFPPFVDDFVISDDGSR